MHADRAESSGGWVSKTIMLSGGFWAANEFVGDGSPAW